MAVTIEDLYRCYGVLADSKDPSQVGGRGAVSASVIHPFPFFIGSFCRLGSGIWWLTQQNEKQRLS